MSVSLWAWSERCEGIACPGDCDLCIRAEDSADLTEGRE